MRKYYTKGVGWEKIFQGGAWRKMSCPVFLHFFTSFVLSRVLDVYFSWEKLCTMGVSSKAICRKRDKILKSFKQKTLNLLTVNK